MYALRSAHALHLTPRVIQLPRLQVRHFHPTRSASSAIIDLALDSSTAFIHGVHNVSCLPWVASIPLTAVLVRTFVGLPIMIYTRLHRHREKKISLILSAWARRYQEKAAAPEKTTSPGKKLTLLERKQKATLDLRNQTAVLHKRWGISGKHKAIGLLQIPVFIALMESLRGMSGNNSGIIAWLSSFIESQDPASAAQSLHLTLEPTLANEGALWFPDLLAGDSTGVLPLFLTASILGNVLTGWKVMPLKEIQLLPKTEMYKQVSLSGLRTFIVVFTCYIGFASWTQEMPAALMLYWITSTNLATLQTWILDNKVFSPVKFRRHVQKSIAFVKPGDEDPFQLRNLR
ncbi:Membrane insertase OXA1/ALB3/YidC [Penicillium cf. griseofulvum]|uniref:Membrane insertase OXA1/ALB3/YidC n=1 Tax=Penicillium cf. griseofulvum TaxID=2972120 RepID=A0A9W9IVJ3_9EURO|nr:Membrane insertase OXA1/ALB3/YidC [Penicillium cf. griseofulvum]KAJ5430423.1 Membrane insertase OXA1/ALB3/YidC [Penicillium cf. griseofulvum]KAJ5435807.1 Membrane insertase OXA1/ALB3/YidC [Penicillium cf. griseofulvum]